MGPNQTFKSLCKEKHKQNEKTYGTGKNVCKWCDWQGVNIQNIQTHTTQYLKTKKKGTIKKWADLKFLQRRHTDGEQTHEKVFNIGNY